MKRILLAAAAAVLATPVLAALPVGNSAPAFEAEAAMAGEQFTFKLSEALKKGPVVVYFYPKANSSGCDVEAHEYSEASDQFAALGASIIGVSTDDIETLKTYSANPETCAGKLAVASDADGSIMKSYDAVAETNPANAAFKDKLAGLADRTTYVVAPDGEILFVFNDIKKPMEHVTGALDAVKAWAAMQGEGQ